MGLFNWLFGKKKNTDATDKSTSTTKKDEEVKISVTKAADEDTAKAEEAKPTTEKTKAATGVEAESTEKKTPVKKKANKTEKATEEASTVDVAAEKLTTEVATAKEEAIETELDVPTEPLSEEAISDPAITGRFEINRSKDGKKYFFNLYASNRVGIATSQMYSTAQSALIGVKSVIANAAKAPIEDQTLKTYETLPFPKWIIYIDKGGKYRFHLSAANGSNVCHSQGYTTKSSCKNGIESIIRSSRNPEITKTYLIK